MLTSTALHVYLIIQKSVNPAQMVLRKVRIRSHAFVALSTAQLMDPKFALIIHALLKMLVLLTVVSALLVTLKIQENALLVNGDSKFLKENA